MSLDRFLALLITAITAPPPRRTQRGGSDGVLYLILVGFAIAIGAVIVAAMTGWFNARLPR